MGRAPCCSKVGLHRGPWTPREDTLLTKYIQAHGEGHWRSLPKKAVNGETTSIKIHLPKPIRLTSFSIPRNNSFDSNNTVSGSSSHDQGDKGVYKGALDLPWSDLKDVGVLVTDEDHDLINGCDLAYRSPIPAKDTMLEKLYEEYLQLLKTEEDQVQLDSFTESLFV
ncbi:hypothetical protein HHK36_000041 [Tetracentron sinense]|uniref:Myb-like domain-containing protein n=1 Tax=Tetracentron sinense TaxID=13715 RepID=A0A835A0W7_TETSI|nr:hypothetical protein HHK36_000041 [Tetracentron sinense]